MERLKMLAGKIWRALPQTVRRMVIRGTQHSFTVSVTAVMRNEEGQILLLDHVLRPNSGWGIPGGFIEGGEMPDEAIRREIREETGLELEDVELFWVRTIGSHVEIIFRARANGEAKINSAEIHSGQWFDPAELPAELAAIQKFVINKTLS